MIEWLRHLLGLCGEPHPSLLTLLIGTPMLGYVLYIVKDFNKNKNEKQKQKKKSN